MNLPNVGARRMGRCGAIIEGRKKMTITGKDLLKFGFEGAELGAALDYVNSQDWQESAINEWLSAN